MGAGNEPAPVPLPTRCRARGVVLGAVLLCACAGARPQPSPSPSTPPGATSGAGGTAVAGAQGGGAGGAGRTTSGASANAPAPPRPFDAPTEKAIAEAARQLIVGRKARQEGNLPAAALAFERAIRADPTAFDARLELVEVLLLQSVELSRAETLLDEARALRAYDVQVDRLRAWLDELRGDYSAAANDYARVLAVDPDADTRWRRAGLLLRLNRVDEAVAEYERVAAERPTDRGTRITLAELYEVRGQLPEAERMLVEIEKIAPGELGPLRRLASFYRRTGQMQKARDTEARLRGLEAPARSLRPLRPSAR